MSETKTVRTEEQIQAELATAREQMSATVDALVARVQPDALMDQAKQSAAAKAAEAKAFVVKTVEDAREGDADALKKVGIAAGCAVALVALVAFRIVRRGR